MVWSGVQGNGLDPTYRAALAAPHVVYNRVDVTDNLGTVLVSDLSVMSASVTATLQSRVARVMRFSTDRSYFPVTAAGAVDPTAPLAPFGNRVKAYRGILYGDGSTTYFPVFTGRIDTCTLDQTGIVQVSCSDLAAEVVDADFETPTGSTTTLTLTQMFQQLVSAAVSNVSFGTSDTFSQYTPALDWQNDRGKACDDLAAAGGGIWYQLPDGGFVLRVLPWTKSGQSAALTLADQGGGLVGGYTISVSRAGVNSSVVLTVERLNANDPPVYAIARDDTSTSPTYYRGKFGLKPRLIQLQTPLTQAQATLTAQSYLKSGKALAFNFSPVQVVPDPSLELGDLISCSADGVVSTQVVTGFTLDLLAPTPMTLQLRAYTPT